MHALFGNRNAGSSTTSLNRALIALPGTGLDAHFARKAFSSAAGYFDATLLAVSPTPGNLIGSYEQALSIAEEMYEEVVIAGISIGAGVATHWARTHRVHAVIAALPPWIGSAPEAPAALSALHTQSMIKKSGLESTIIDMQANSPQWLGNELARSWRELSPGLIDLLAEAAEYRCPSLTELTEISAPVAVVAVHDDPIHPIDIAQQWQQQIPCSQLYPISLADIGTDFSAIGQAIIP